MHEDEEGYCQNLSSTYHPTRCNNDEITIECRILQPSGLGQYRSGIAIAVSLVLQNKISGSK